MGVTAQKVFIPQHVTGSAKQHYRDLCEQLGGPPAESWRVMKLGNLAILEDKHHRGKADEIELTIMQRERRLLGLPPQ